MRLLRLILADARVKNGFADDSADALAVGMAILMVRGQHDLRTSPANQLDYAADRFLPDLFQATVRQSEVVPFDNPEQFVGCRRFLLAALHISVGGQLRMGQIQDCGALALLGCQNQAAGGADLYIIRMSADDQ